MAGNIVCKYGGSSSTSLETLEIKKRITNDDYRRQILVLSAHGEVDGEKKDTELLIELAKTKDLAIIDKIIGKARKIYPGMPDSRFYEMRQELHSRVKQDLPDLALEDSVKSFGEYMCAKLSAEFLGYEYIDPRELFFISDDFGKGKILPQSEKMIKERLYGKKGPFVIPGFYGFSENGQIVTLSRGGSDLTGSYIASALESSVYENFTDKAGIMAAQPEIVKNPRKIEEITFDEIRDLAYSGFSIFHEEAMQPLNKKGIPVHVRNTFTYPSIGTRIVKDREILDDRAIVGVAYKPGFFSFDMEFFGLNDSIGAMRKMLSIFEDEKVPVTYITTGIDDMAVIVNSQYFKGKPKLEENISAKMREIIERDSRISIHKNLGSLVIAGKGLKGKRGISAGIQAALANGGINIRFISQGPLERSIIYGIQSSDGEKAANIIYDKYLR